MIYKSSAGRNGCDGSREPEAVYTSFIAVHVDLEIVYDSDP